jgi:hypothetical protein
MLPENRDMLSINPKPQNICQNFCLIAHDSFVFEFKLSLTFKLSGLILPKITLPRILIHS